MNAGPETWKAEQVELAVEGLHRSGSLCLRLGGASMLPSLWPGDEVEFTGCIAADVLRGDVVLAIRDGRFFVHRVLGFDDAGDVITRGDAMPGPDPVLPADAVIGRAVRLVRGERRFPISRHFMTLRRACGIVFCYSNLARQIALRLHNRRVQAVGVHPRETQQPVSTIMDAR